MSRAPAMLLATGVAGSIAFVTNGIASSTAGADTYSNLNPNPGGTFTGIGLVIGWFGNGASRTGSSVTVNGVSATFLARQTSSNATIEIWACAGTACTDVDIVLSGAALGLMLDVITFTGANAPTTATDTAGSTADPSVLTIDVEAGGLIIAGGWCTNGGNSTWTNATEATGSDRTITDSGGNILHQCAAYNASASAQTNLAVSDNYSVTFVNAGVAVAIR